MSPERRVTTQDIAEAAGVTSGTVSRALRGDPVVSPKTRQRIQEIARGLDYHPNLSARALRTGRSGTLALVCSTGPWLLHHPYFAPISSGFITAAAEEGVRVTVYVPPSVPSSPVSVTEQDWPREMHNGLVDGCAIYQAHRLSQESMAYLRDAKLAVVLLNTDTETPGFCQLLSNAGQRIRESLQWARELGARRVGVLGLAERMQSANAPLSQRLTPPKGVSAFFQPIAHYDPDEPGAVDAALSALMGQRPEALVFNSTFHILRYLEGSKRGVYPADLPLFYHKPASAPWGLPGVHYMISDLFGAGRLGYELMKQAQSGREPSLERLRWKREGQA